ncbi:MAG: hypothetical protein ACRD8K_02475 [Nitrososphaeraceae archaeon]
MFGLTKHCPVCGMDVEKEIGIKRFGNYFCSDSHAQQYTEKRMASEISKEEDSHHGGGCC